MIDVEFENPHDYLLLTQGRSEIVNGQPLPICGGPDDGEWLPVPIMFGQIAPLFMRRGNHVYQLNSDLMLWRFAFTIGRDWNAYREPKEKPAG